MDIQRRNERIAQQQHREQAALHAEVAHETPPRANLRMQDQHRMEDNAMRLPPLRRVNPIPDWTDEELARIQILAPQRWASVERGRIERDMLRAIAPSTLQTALHDVMTELARPANQAAQASEQQLVALPQQPVAPPQQLLALLPPPAGRAPEPDGRTRVPPGTSAVQPWSSPPPRDDDGDDRAGGSGSDPGTSDNLILYQSPAASVVQPRILYTCVEFGFTLTNERTEPFCRLVSDVAKQAVGHANPAIVAGIMYVLLSMLINRTLHAHLVGEDVARPDFNVSLFDVEGRISNVNGSKVCAVVLNILGETGCGKSTALECVVHCVLRLLAQVIDKRLLPLLSPAV